MISKKLLQSSSQLRMELKFVEERCLERQNIWILMLNTRQKVMKNVECISLEIKPANYTVVSLVCLIHRSD